MAAMDQPGVRELVLDFAGPIFGARIQQLLNALPTLACHQRLVSASVRRAIPIEIACVQAFPQDLVDDAAVESASTQLYAFRGHLFHQRLHRVTTLKIVYI